MCHYHNDNANMTTDEEKTKLSKLLQSVDVPDIKLTERCSGLLKEFHKKYDDEVDIEETHDVDFGENPYKVDQMLLDQIDHKLKELVMKNRRITNDNAECILIDSDPKRPWRTNTYKEKLHQINGVLKRHHEKATEMIIPLAEHEIKHLVKECQQETDKIPLVGSDKLRETVNAAKKNLPNFQYRKIENTTATSILAKAHEEADHDRSAAGDLLNIDF